MVGSRVAKARILTVEIVALFLRRGQRKPEAGCSCPARSLLESVLLALRNVGHFCIARTLAEALPRVSALADLSQNC